MVKFYLLIVLMALTIFPVVAQEDIRVETLTDVTGVSTPTALRTAVISPDASMLAWSRGVELCIYTFADEETNCTPYPEMYRGDNPLVWSPDSKYLAFTENFFIQLREPDIWLFDLEAGMFFNRTDDGQIREIIRPPEGGRPRYIDTMPTWHPITGDLYFFRSVEMELFGNDIRTTQLMRIAAEDVPVWAVEPEEVANLTMQFDIPFSIYNPPDYTLNGALAFSPDGTQLAMLVRPNQFDSPDWGLWLFELEMGRLRKLASREELNAGLPEWVDEPIYTDGVAWTGENLVVSLVDRSLNTGVSVSQVLYVDTATGEITPLMDFSGIEAPDFFNIDPESGIAPSFDMPRASVLTPDGETLLYLNMSTDGVAGFSALALPPNGDAPVRWWETEPVPRLPFNSPSVGTDGDTVRIVTAGYLVTYQR